MQPSAEGGVSLDERDPEPLPDEQIIRWEGIGLVRLSLAALDERSRELVRLKFSEDLSYKQISERTGLTVGHVGYLLHHALMKGGLFLGAGAVVHAAGTRDVARSAGSSRRRRRTCLRRRTRRAPRPRAPESRDRG